MIHPGKHHCHKHRSFFYRKELPNLSSVRVQKSLITPPHTSKYWNYPIMSLVWDTPPCIGLLHDSPAPWQRVSTPTISSSYGRCSQLVVPFLTWLKRSPMKNSLKRELAIFYMLTSPNEVLGLTFQNQTYQNLAWYFGTSVLTRTTHPAGCLTSNSASSGTRWMKSSAKSSCQTWTETSFRSWRSICLMWNWNTFRRLHLWSSSFQFQLITCYISGSQLGTLFRAKFWFGIFTAPGLLGKKFGPTKPDIALWTRSSFSELVNGKHQIGETLP